MRRGSVGVGVWLFVGVSVSVSVVACGSEWEGEYVSVRPWGVFGTWCTQGVYAGRVCVYFLCIE